MEGLLAELLHRTEAEGGEASLRKSMPVLVESGVPVVEVRMDLSDAADEEEEQKSRPRKKSGSPGRGCGSPVRGFPHLPAPWTTRKHY